MSNDVINPYQTFRDDKGNVLAGGKLRILQNRTSALGTAYSDSALNVPQQVDPYTLDTYGRVRADLHWQGLRSVQVLDRNDQHIRTLPDVSTLVDTSGFAIVFASVAAMAAEATLEAGDVAETLSYNAGQRQGGARYLITASAEAVDDYRVIDLAPAGLQARLLDEQQHRSPFAAGAVGDLSANDTAPVQAVLDVVTDVQVDGTFLCDNLTLSASKRLSGGGMLQLSDFAGTDLLSISGEDVVVLIDGITLDGNVSNQLAARETALISSAITASSATALALVRCNNVTFQNASQNDLKGVADDMGFQVVYALSECAFIDGEQSTSAVGTACVRLEDGAYGYIDDCYFSLGAAVDTGRSAVTTGNSGSAVTNYGELMLTGSTLNLMGNDEATTFAGAVQIGEMNRVVINGNRILTPNYAGIVMGAECDQAVIGENLVDGLTGTGAPGQIVTLTTTAANAGNDWMIGANILANSAAVGVLLNGSSAGTDAARVRVQENQITGPAGQAITYTDLIDLDIVGNFIDMQDAAGINAIEAVANGIAGQCVVAGNEILNVDDTTSSGGTGFDDQVSTGGVYFIDGNYFEGGAIGLQVDGGPDDVFITNNVFDSITDTLGILDNITNCWVDGNAYTGTDPTSGLTMTGGGGITNLKVGENFWTEVDTTINVQAVTGSNITVGAPHAHYMLLDPTGATSIDTISSPGIDGYQVTYQNLDGAANITFNNAADNINLGASTRVLGDVTDTLTLVWNETNSEWNEAAFANN